MKNSHVVTTKVRLVDCLKMAWHYFQQQADGSLSALFDTKRQVGASWA